MTTAQKIINQAMDGLSLRGVGQTVDGTILTEVLATLNVLLDSMNLGATFAFAETETVYAMPSATTFLTIGPAMQINIPRPVRIEDSSFVRVSGNDYDLRVIDRQQYNDITQKDQGGSWPSYVFYDAGNPTGKLFFWQTGACELHVVTRQAVASFADLTTAYILPTGLERMLWSSLAEEIATTFETQPSASLVKIAAQARRSWKRSNLQVPELDIPDIGNTSSDGQYGNILGGWRS